MTKHKTHYAKTRNEWTACRRAAWLVWRHTARKHRVTCGAYQRHLVNAGEESGGGQ